MLQSTFRRWNDFCVLAVWHKLDVRLPQTIRCRRPRQLASRGKMHTATENLVFELPRPLAAGAEDSVLPAPMLRQPLNCPAALLHDGRLLEIPSYNPLLIILVEETVLLSHTTIQKLRRGRIEPLAGLATAKRGLNQKAANCFRGFWWAGIY